MLAARLIEQIGSYAGLAAIPGLAVLSALYFSQARDVRRLREWAGRAPERAAEQAVGGRVAVQPQQAAQPGAQPAQVATPAAATPAAATPGAVQPAKPAVAAAAGAQTATAAGPATATPEDAEKKEAGKPAALTPAAVASAAAAKAPAKAGVAAGNAGGNATGTVTRPGPPAVGGGRPTAPVRRTIPRPASSQTSILTPTAKAKEPWYRRLGARLPAGRYIALIVAGALVLGGGAAFGISQLASKDSGGGGSSNAGGNSAGKSSTPSGKKDKSASNQQNVKSSPVVNPADVTVTVVNGTTIPNLARDTATKLSGFGFQIGNKVTGTGSLAAAESVVEYKPGAEAEARAVAAKLNINQKQPADADALAQAGVASIIVVLGADQAPGG
jgi:hypothetical protein